MNHQFSIAIDAIYGAASDPASWPAALQSIADVHQDVGAIFSYQREDGRFGAIGTTSLGPLLEEYARDWEGRDFRSLRGTERAAYVTHQVVTDDELATPQEIDTNPFYDLLRKHGLRHFAGSMVSPDPKVVAYLAVQRGIARDAFTPAEKQVLGKLFKHAESSLRLGIKLLEAEILNIGLIEAFDRLAIGVYVLDSLGRTLFINRKGESLLDRTLFLQNGKLCVGDNPNRSAVTDAIARMVRRGAGDDVPQARPALLYRAAGPLAVHVLPAGCGISIPEQILSSARAIVLAIEATPSERLDPALVRDLLDLTLGEARVASLVGSGLPPREAAEQLGITEGTARTTLKQVFGKLGISRQSELAAMLTRLVPR